LNGGDKLAGAPEYNNKARVAEDAGIRLYLLSSGVTQSWS
jgi:hypothetical protein